MNYKPLLLLEIFLPLLLVFGNFVWVYTSDIGSQPKYDFLYSPDWWRASWGNDCVDGVPAFGSNSDIYSYRLINGRLKVVQNNNGSVPIACAETKPQLYRYNVKNHTSTPISDADAEKLKVSNSDINSASPDGFYAVGSRESGTIVISKGGVERTYSGMVVEAGISPFITWVLADN